MHRIGQIVFSRSAFFKETLVSVFGKALLVALMPRRVNGGYSFLLFLLL